MQEEVNQKTVALSIKTAKLTGKVLAAALGKVVRALQKHHRKALTPQGRQSVKKLMNHYGGKNAMQYVGAPKDFDRIAKEFHVDYAFHKVSPGHYLLFFKANQADAITAAFHYTGTESAGHGLLALLEGGFAVRNEVPVSQFAASLQGKSAYPARLVAVTDKIQCLPYSLTAASECLHQEGLCFVICQNLLSHIVYLLIYCSFIIPQSLSA